MTRGLLAITAVAIALQAGTASAADPMPAATVRTYEPYSNGTDYTLGRMRLSATSATFLRLKGRLALEPAGTISVQGSSETDGATVYRVINAEEFFKLNQGRNGFCDAPIRWVGVRDLGRERIRISFLTIPDFRDYRPTEPGLCAADSYGLK
jgi:hypothetical protein